MNAIQFQISIMVYPSVAAETEVTVVMAETVALPETAEVVDMEETVAAPEMVETEDTEETEVVAGLSTHLATHLANPVAVMVVVEAMVDMAASRWRMKSLRDNYQILYSTLKIKLFMIHKHKLIVILACIIPEHANSENDKHR